MGPGICPPKTRQTHRQRALNGPPAHRTHLRTGCAHLESRTGAGRCGVRSTRVQGAPSARAQAREPLPALPPSRATSCGAASGGVSVAEPAPRHAAPVATLRFFLFFYLFPFSLLVCHHAASSASSTCAWPLLAPNCRPLERALEATLLSTSADMNDRARAPPCRVSSSNAMPSAALCTCSHSATRQRRNETTTERATLRGHEARRARQCMATAAASVP